MKKLITIIACFVTIIVLSGEEQNVKRYDIPIEGLSESEIEIEFNLGSLEIRTGNGKYLLRGAAIYSDDRLRPHIRHKKIGDRSKLHIYTETNEFNKSINSVFDLFNKKDLDNVDNEWKLEFTKNIPLEYSISMGMAEGQLDFSGQKITDMEIECGMGDVSINIDQPNPVEMRSFTVETGMGEFSGKGMGNLNPEKFTIDCGMGSTDISFDGKIKNDMEGEVSVGMGSVSIDLPRNIGAEVYSESSFLSNVDLDDFDKIDDSTYRSENWDDTVYRVYIKASVGMGSININWID
ncbi:MAG: toast rack family protein [Candidatus Marinimicrobia bacterium]|nr:toast rack family protein [Candidatus Neomarinimicrobiota bacterium]